ncbi:unnamed protein product [Lampetra planeri]
MLTKAQIAAEAVGGSQADGGLGPKRPVSLGSTGSSSSSRDSHLSFGSSLVLASSPSSSLAPGDSGCSCSERDAFSDREPELGKMEALTTTAAGGRCPPEPQEDGVTAPAGQRAGRNGQLQEAVLQVRESNILELEEEDTRRSSSGSSGSSGSQEMGRLGKEGTRVRMTLAADGCSLSSLERVLLEMLQTERAYVRDLSSIVQDYLGCMEATPGLPLSSQDLGTLFGNVRSIYTLNRDLLQDLEVCALDPVAAARCFISKSEAFQIYTEYCMNYPNAVRVLAECMRSPELGAVLASRQAALCHSLPLGSYLLKPVQRILKYHLLLHEVSRHCEDGTWERAPIQEALDTMTGVAQHINEVKRRHEQASRVQEIERLLSSWHGPELGRYGELVLEGVFRVARARNQRTFFLFTNILLFARRRDHIYVCKGHILCANLMLVENLPKEPLSFTIGHFKNPKIRHTLQAHSVEEKRLWVHELKRLILENYPSDIPLKAKQAILDMDGSCSPATHCGRDDPKKESWYTRRGRRKSEPGDRKPKPLESLASVRKRSGSVDGGLLRDAEVGGGPGLGEGSTESLERAASTGRRPLPNGDMRQDDRQKGQADRQVTQTDRRDGPAGQQEGRADAREARPCGDAAVTGTGQQCQQLQSRRVEAKARSQTAATDPTLLGFKQREGECSLRAQAGRRFLYRQSVDLEGMHLSPILSQPMLEVLAAELKYEWLVAPQYGKRVAPVKAQCDGNTLENPEGGATLPSSGALISESALATAVGGRGMGKDTHCAGTDQHCVVSSAEPLLAAGSEVQPVEHDEYPSKHHATNVKVGEEEQESHTREDGAPQQERAGRVVRESIIIDDDDEPEEFYQDRNEAIQVVDIMDTPQPCDDNQKPVETKVLQLDFEMLPVKKSQQPLMENSNSDQTDVAVQPVCDDSSTKERNGEPESELYRHAPCESPSRGLPVAPQEGPTHPTNTVDAAPSFEGGRRLNASEADDVWLSCQDAAQMLEETLGWEAAGCVSSHVSCEETSALTHHTSDDSQRGDSATDGSISASHPPKGGSPSEQGNNDEDVDDGEDTTFQFASTEVVRSNVFRHDQAEHLPVQAGFSPIISPLENLSPQTALTVTQCAPADVDVVAEHCRAVVQTVTSELVSSPFVRKNGNDVARGNGVGIEREGRCADSLPAAQPAPVSLCAGDGETRGHDACQAETGDVRGMDIIEMLTLEHKFIEDYFSNLTSTAPEQEQLVHSSPVSSDVEVSSATSKEAFSENENKTIDTWADLISSIESSLAEFRDNIPPTIWDVDHTPLFIEEEEDSCPRVTNDSNQSPKAAEESVEFALPHARNELEHIGNSQAKPSDDGCTEGIWFDCTNYESTNAAAWNSRTSRPGFQNERQCGSSCDSPDNFSRTGRNDPSISGATLMSPPPGKPHARSGREGKQSPQPTELPRAGARVDIDSECYSQRFLAGRDSDASRSRLADILGNGRASPPTRKAQTGLRRAEPPTVLARPPSSPCLSSPSDSPQLTRCPSTSGLFRTVSPAQSCCVQESHTYTGRSCRSPCRRNHLHESHCSSCNADWFSKPYNNAGTSAGSVDHQLGVCKECGSCQPASPSGRGCRLPGQWSLQSHTPTLGMCKCPSTPNLFHSSSLSLESQFHFPSVPSRNSFSNFLHSYTLSNSETNQSCSSLDYEFSNMTAPFTRIIKNPTPTAPPRYSNVSSRIPCDSVIPPYHSSPLPSDLLRSPSEGSLLSPSTQSFLKSYASALEICNNNMDQAELPFESKSKNSTPKSSVLGTAPGEPAEYWPFVPDDTRVLVHSTHTPSHEPYRVRSRSLGFQGLSGEHCEKTRAGLPESPGGLGTPASAHFPESLGLERGSYYGSHIVLQDADKAVVVDRVFPQRVLSMNVSIRKMYANSLCRRDRRSASPPRQVETTLADGRCRWLDYTELSSGAACRPPIPHRARSHSFRSQKRMPPVLRDALI